MRAEARTSEGRSLSTAKPDGRVEVVHKDRSRPERYQVILPRQDELGWRGLWVEADPGRRELIAPGLCDARGIHLSVVRMPVGVEDRPHWHVSGEKVMYVVGGRGQIIAGEELDEEFNVGPGDAVYVPPFAVHAPRNVGTDVFEFVMVSNAPLDVTVPGGPPPGDRTRETRERR